MTVSGNLVAISRSDKAEYPADAPFHPQDQFPEYKFSEFSSEKNYIYNAVRQSFYLLGLDKENYGTKNWNPLKEFIHKGDTVLLKPNLVKEFHPRDKNGWEYILTHGSVIRAVADYVFLALEGEGKVILGDAPQTDSSFTTIVKLLKLQEITDYYKSKDLDFSLLDFRKEEWENKNDVIVKRTKLTGDPYGYFAFDLAEKSEFHSHSGVGNYYGADYDSDEVNSHHNGHKNEYLITGAAIKCDVYFNIAKLKTHKKAGVTINLKNLVGVNGDKNWLPHHTEGDPTSGGDQFPEIKISQKAENSSVHLLKKLALGIPFIGPKIMQLARPIGKKIFGDTENIIRSGNWYGNDTVWRMCLDLNKLVLYGHNNGTLKEDTLANRKRYLCLVDGFIAGEGRGPMNPDPFDASLCIFGTNPVAVDAVGATLMGFDINKIPIIPNAFKVKHYKLVGFCKDEILCQSNVPDWSKKIFDIEKESVYSFKPHFGWTGHIEKTGAADVKVNTTVS